MSASGFSEMDRRNRPDPDRTIFVGPTRSRGIPVLSLHCEAMMRLPPGARMPRGADHSFHGLVVSLVERIAGTAGDDRSKGLLDRDTAEVLYERNRFLMAVSDFAEVNH